MRAPLAERKWPVNSVTTCTHTHTWCHLITVLQSMCRYKEKGGSNFSINRKEKKKKIHTRTHGVNRRAHIEIKWTNEPKKKIHSMEFCEQCKSSYNKRVNLFRELIEMCVCARTFLIVATRLRTLFFSNHRAHDDKMASEKTNWNFIFFSRAFFFSLSYTHLPLEVHVCDELLAHHFQCSRVHLCDC